MDHGVSLPSYEPSSVTDKRGRASSSSSASSTKHSDKKNKRDSTLTDSFSDLSISDEPKPNLAGISNAEIEQYIRDQGYGRMRFNITQILEVLEHFNVAITNANVRQIACKCKNYVNYIYNFFSL